MKKIFAPDGIFAGILLSLLFALLGYNITMWQWWVLLLPTVTLFVLVEHFIRERFCNHER